MSERVHNKETRRLIFTDRSEAGAMLARELREYRNQNPHIIALPRGGVPVAYEVSKSLNAALDIVVPRKLGTPGDEEFAFGAIAPNDTVVLDYFTIVDLNIQESYIEQVIHSETIEMMRRIQEYRGNTKMPNLDKKTVILVDDGIATGLTTLAAIKYLQTLNPKKIVVASPICSDEGFKGLSKLVEVICIVKSSSPMTVASFYADFTQITDREVLDILAKARNGNLLGKFYNLLKHFM